MPRRINAFLVLLASFLHREAHFLLLFLSLYSHRPQLRRVYSRPRPISGRASIHPTEWKRSRNASLNSEYVYTKQEEKKEIDSKERERERREGRKTPWARICVCIFHLYTWKILLGRIQALWMIRQLLPRWNRFAWIVQIVFPWFSSTRVNGTKFLVEM